jgi:hypothetical protein
MYSFKGENLSFRVFTRDSSNSINSKAITYYETGLTKVKYGQIIDHNHLALIGLDQ